MSPGILFLLHLLLHLVLLLLLLSMSAQAGSGGAARRWLPSTAADKPQSGLRPLQCECSAPLWPQPPTTTAAASQFKGCSLGRLPVASSEIPMILPSNASSFEPIRRMCRAFAAFHTLGALGAVLLQSIPGSPLNGSTYSQGVTIRLNI